MVYSIDFICLIGNTFQSIINACYLENIHSWWHSTVNFQYVWQTKQYIEINYQPFMKDFWISQFSLSSGTKHPAYQRFGHLLEAKKPAADQATHNLPLPYHFKMLEEMFRCVDVVLSLKHKRHESCTFEKLKYSVQEMIRKWVTVLMWSIKFDVLWNMFLGLFELS